MSKSFSFISYLRELHKRLVESENSDQNNGLRQIEQWLIRCLEAKISEYEYSKEFDKQLAELLTELSTTIITEQKSTNRIKISFEEHNYEIPFGYFLEMLLDKNMHKDLINAAAISDKDVQSAFGKVIKMRKEKKPGRAQLYCDCDLNKKQENNIKTIEKYFSNYESSIGIFKEIINTQIDSDKVRTILAVEKILKNFVKYINNEKIKGHKNSKTKQFYKELQLLDEKTNSLNSPDASVKIEKKTDILNAYVENYRMRLLKELNKIKNPNQLKDKCDYLGWDPKAAESYPDCYKKAREAFPQLTESYPDENLSGDSKSIEKKIAELSSGKTNLIFPKADSPLESTDFFVNMDFAINCLYKIYVQGNRNNYVPPGLLYGDPIQETAIYDMHQDYRKAFEHIGKYAAEIKEGISLEARRNDEYVYFHKEEGIALFYKRDTDGREKLVNITWNISSQLISKCLEELLNVADTSVNPFIRMLNVCDSYVGATPVASMEIGNYSKLAESCLQTIKSQKILMISAGSVVDHVLKYNLPKNTNPVTGNQFNLLKFTDEEAKLLIKDYFEKVRSLSEKFTAEDASRIEFTLNGNIDIQFKKTKEEMDLHSLHTYTVTPNLELILKTAASLPMEQIEIEKENVYCTSKKSGRMFTLKKDAHIHDLKFFQPDNFLVDSSIFAHSMGTFLRKHSTEEKRPEFPNERKKSILLLHEQCGIKMNMNGKVEEFDLPENLKTLSIGVESIPMDLVADFLQTWKKEKKNLQRLRLASFEKVSNKRELADELLKNVRAKPIWRVTDHDETMFCDTNIEEYKDKLQKKYGFDECEDPVLLYFGASDDLSRLFSLVVSDYGIRLDFRPNDDKKGLNFLKQTFQAVTKVENHTWVNNWLFEKTYSELELQTIQ